MKLQKILKYTLPLLISFGMITILPAQTFKAMVVIGGNLSQIDGDKLGGFNKLGLNTGLRVSADLNDRWSLSTEFLYSQQGASAVPTDNITSIYDKIRLQFVEVPLMVNFSDWKILASGGVSFNRLAKYAVKDIFGDNITDSENYNDNLFSIVLGATFFLTEKWALNIRWSKSMNNLRVATDNNPTRFLTRNIGVRMYYSL